MKTGENIVGEMRKDRKTGADRLVAEYRRRLYKVAYDMCGDANEAEDLVFRTFEQVIDKIDGYREEEAFFSWMCTILRNYHRMSKRRNVDRNTVPSGGLDELAGVSGETGAETVVAPLDGDILRKAVDGLPPKMREVVVLHYFMDQPVARVAKMLSISKGTVKSRLYYARVVLADRLCVAMKKPTVVLAMVGLFVAAAVSAVTFAGSSHDAVPEVDEPVYVDDSPLEAEPGESECWGFAPRVTSIPPAIGAACATNRERCTSKAAVVPAFRSSGRMSLAVPLHSFNSDPAGTRVIISR